MAVEIGTGAGLQTTNELPLTIAPRIVKEPPAFPLPLDVTRDADQSAEIVLKVSPKVQPRQRASLLLGDREVFAEPHTTATDTLTFEVPNAPLGDRFLRLRIDGVDSLLVQLPAGQAADLRCRSEGDDPMSDAADWPQANDAFLSAALAWLRLRLERLAVWEQPPVRARRASGAGGPAAGRLLPGALLPARAGRDRAAAVLALPPASEAVTEAQIADAAKAMAAAEEIDPPPALALLAQRFGLSRFERDVLLLCAALELDTRIAPLCARAQDDPARPYPTFALALSLFDDPAWDVLSPERPLRHWRFLEINQPGAQPLVTSALRADERIVNFIKGLNYLDDRLTPLLLPVEPPGGEADLPPSQAAAVRQILQRLEAAETGRRPPVFQLVGPDAPSKRLVAWHAASALGLRLFRLPVELLPTQVADLETLARLSQRESALSPFALYLDAQEVERTAPAEGGAPPLGRFLASTRGLFFVATQDVRPGLGETSVALDVAKPTPAEQREAWTAALGDAAGELPLELASQFSLDLGSLRRDRPRRPGRAAAETDELRDRLWAGALAGTRPRLEGLAQRLDPRATWDDLVLPERQSDLLHQIAAQVRLRGRVYDDWGFAAKRNRGLGISVLFAGESGTGKTMAAEVLANDLRLSLYRIDLSTVVSKYIGETEKNLRRLFDAAEDGGAILFFDEADALFGKRSEVKDSHDRYANIEINYLLQRIESYRGLAILATNLKDHLDSAFMRRLRFIVDFPAHGEAERREIWQRIFPPETRTEGLDLDRLARLGLNGGAINNVAMNAAFLAAAKNEPVTMPHILAAARTELQKIGPSDQRSRFPLDRAQARRGAVVNVNLHIERLILDGIDVEPAQRPVLQAVVEAELGRLIAEGGVGGLAAGAVPAVRADGFQMSGEGIRASSGGRSRGRCMGGLGSESADGAS